MSRLNDTSCRTRLYNCLANFFELYKTHKYFSLRSDIEIAKLDILIDWKKVAEIPVPTWLRQPNFGHKTLYLLLQVLAEKGLGEPPNPPPKTKKQKPLRRFSQSTLDVVIQFNKGKKARFIQIGNGHGQWIIGIERANCTQAIIALASRGYLWITPGDKMTPLAGLNAAGRSYFAAEEFNTLIEETDDAYSAL